VIDILKKKPDFRLNSFDEHALLKKTIEPADSEGRPPVPISETRKPGSEQAQS
jgi:hypothetical protein